MRWPSREAKGPEVAEVEAEAGGGGGGGGGSGDHSRHIQYDAANREYVLRGGGGGIRRVSEYDVERSLSTALCGECHEDAVAQLKNSIHFSAQGPNPRILFPGGGAHGALDRACGLPGTTALINYTSNINLGECGKCHVGRFIPPMQNAFTSVFMQMGMPPELAATNATSLVDGGLDCLICHADHYLSVRDDIDWSVGGTLEIAGYAEPGEHSPSPQGYAQALPRDNTDFDHDGQPDLLIDANGDGVCDMPLMQDLDGDGIPETPWPTMPRTVPWRPCCPSARPTSTPACAAMSTPAPATSAAPCSASATTPTRTSASPIRRLTADDPNCPEHNTCTACHVTLERGLRRRRPGRCAQVRARAPGRRRSGRGRLSTSASRRAAPTRTTRPI